MPARGAGRRLCARRRAEEGAALCLRGRRDQPRPGEGQRPVFAHPHAAHLRGPVPLRPPGTADQGQAAHGRRHARALPRLPLLDDPDHARHLLRGRPGVQGQAARAHCAGLCLRVQALRRPGEPEPRLDQPGDRSAGRPERAAPGCARREQALRLRPRDRGRARARPLHAALHARRTAPALLREPRLRRSVRCGGARGRRVLRRGGRGASGRHRAVQACAVAPQLVHRVRAQPGFPRDAVRRRARGRRCRRPGAARALQGPAPADDRPRRDLDHRRGAAALARVRQQRGRPRVRDGLPVRRAGDAERPRRVAPRQARHQGLPQPRADGLLRVLQHGRPGRGRLRRSQHRPAPSDRAGPGQPHRDRLRVQRAGHRGADAASSSRGTTPIPSSASPTPPTRARSGRASKPKSWSVWPGCARPRSTRRNRSTTTARSKACAH